MKTEKFNIDDNFKKRLDNLYGFSILCPAAGRLISGNNQLCSNMNNFDSCLGAYGNSSV